MTDMRLYYWDSSAARLAALLQRQNKLAEITVYRQEAIPAFSLAIVKGCCGGIERLYLCLDQAIAVTQERANPLVGALEMGGTLPALSVLTIACNMASGGFSKLARALAGGNAPQLQHFRMYVSGPDNDMASIADMLEARPRIPRCMRLKSFVSWDDWHDLASVETRIRLLRALLPSVEELPRFKWNQALESCFLRRKRRI